MIKYKPIKQSGKFAKNLESKKYAVMMVKFEIMLIRIRKIYFRKREFDAKYPVDLDFVEFFHRCGLFSPNAEGMAFILRWKPLTLWITDNFKNKISFYSRVDGDSCK